MQRCPLPEEKKLTELDKVDLLPVVLHPIDQGLWFTHRQWARPLIPGRTVKAVPNRPKERVVGEPVTVLVAKDGELTQPVWEVGYREIEGMHAAVDLS